MDKFKKNWFYLEPYIIAEPKTSNLLLLNCLNGSFMVFKMSPLLKELIKKLLGKGNNYCVKLKKEYFLDEKAKIFLLKTKRNYYGDIIDFQIISKKPFLPFPIMNYQRDETRIDIKSSTHGQDIMLNLRELTVFLNSRCDINCKFCNVIFKQTLYCTKKFEEELPIEKLKYFLDQLPEENRIHLVNVTGANILKYRQLDALCESLMSKGFSASYQIHYLNIDLENTETIAILNKIPRIEILVCFPFNFKKIEDINSQLKNSKTNFSFKAIIENERQFSFISEYFSQKQIDNFEILPIYNYKNIGFFKKFIYVKRKDLNSKKVFKNQYFMNQAFNINNFGKITLVNNGDLYSNVNFPPLGNINSASIYDILYSEIYNGNSWKLIRNLAPCNECIFQYMCPPISNYELILGRYNLCKINPQC